MPKVRESSNCRYFHVAKLQLGCDRRQSVSEPIEADAAAFAEITREAKVPILVDFWAPWCGPCRVAAPEVHELAREMAGRGLVLKVNTEEYPTLANQFRVQSIPYFVLLRRGIIIAERTGVVPRAEMRRWFAMAA